jgi:hypothetical protein
MPVIDPGGPSTNGDGLSQCSPCNFNDDCITGALCVGSTETGANDGSCVVPCDPANSTTLLVTFYLDCVSPQCAADLVALDIAAMANDCIPDLSTCGPIDGSTQNYCVPTSACIAPISGTP